MLARRLTVVCDRAEVGDALRTALSHEGWESELVEPADVLPHQLDGACLIALDTSATTDVVARLRGHARAIVVLGAPSLPAIVEWLSASPRVVAVVAPVALDTRALAASTLDDGRVDLEQVLGAGAAVTTHVVADDSARRAYLAQLAQHVAAAGVPVGLQRAIEQACDELVTNALYAAPVDAEGRPLFGELSSADRVRYRADAAVTARFGANEGLYAISVRDEYGSLQRVTALAFLHKGIHATNKVDRRSSGAGLGLYLIASECAAMHIFIEQGISTEIVCVFDVRAERQQLRRLSLVSVDGDPAEVAARTRTRSARPRAVQGARRPYLVLGALAVLAAAVVGVVAWRVLRKADDKVSIAITTDPRDATVTVDGRAISGTPAKAGGLRPGVPVVITADHPAYVAKRVVAMPRAGEPISVALSPRPPVLDIDSTPPGATVLVDGASVGETPLVVTNLPPGREVAVTLRREGFSETTTRATVPAPGKRADVRAQLSPAPGYALVRIESTPPGARVVDASGRLGKTPVFTPADIVVSTTDEHQFSLVMPRHLPAVLPPFKGAAGLSRSATLAAVPVIQIEAARAGTATVLGVSHCTALELPAECPVSPGTHTVEIRAAGHPTVRHTANVGDQDVVIRY